MTQNKLRKTDRRTLYTQAVIKDALLELTKTKPYDKINVSQLCKEAQIARTTFYLHYENLDEVLDSILDDALLFSEQGTGTIADVMHVFKKNDSQNIKNHEPLLPACQRIADSKKYHHLFMDPSISQRIISRIANHEKDKVIPTYMNQFGLAEDEAEMLFRFILNGTFAVNRSLGWEKNERWYRYQHILSLFINNGSENIKS